MLEPAPTKRPTHKWTDEEREFVRQWYGKVSTVRLAERIGVPRKSVSLVASSLGISPRPKAKTHHWTDAEDDMLRREYQQNNQSARHLASKLGLTDTQVKSRVANLGLCKVTARRPWTAAEDARVTLYMAKGISVAEIAKRLKRGRNSVKLRANRYLRLHPRDREGWYTKGEACAILGVDHKWVQARIDNGALRARPHFPGDTPNSNGYHPWHITEKDLRDFIQTYPHELTGRNVDLVSIVDILAGLKTATKGGS